MTWNIRLTVSNVLPTTQSIHLTAPNVFLTTWSAHLTTGNVFLTTGSVHLATWNVFLTTWRVVPDTWRGFRLTRRAMPDTWCVNNKKLNGHLGNSLHFACIYIWHSLTTISQTLNAKSLYKPFRTEKSLAFSLPTKLNMHSVPWRDLYLGGKSCRVDPVLLTTMCLA